MIRFRKHAEVGFSSRPAMRWAGQQSHYEQPAIAHSAIGVSGPVKLDRGVATFGLLVAGALATLAALAAFIAYSIH